MFQNLAFIHLIHVEPLRNEKKLKKIDFLAASPRDSHSRLFFTPVCTEIATQGVPGLVKIQNKKKFFKQYLNVFQNPIFIHIIHIEHSKTPSV